MRAFPNDKEVICQLCVFINFSECVTINIERIKWTVIGGIKFQKLVNNCKCFRGRTKNTTQGYPPCRSFQNYLRVDGKLF
jgi:hypothetical protein